jgi:UDP-N-acetylmuramate: L-alanyl-gamma-D-glutamyl-meso-diaminopimelate ligase
MKIHFIAIGGSVMHNLAIALHKKGYRVTGSDDKFFDPSKSRLEKYGLLPEKEGWHPEKINIETEAVILGMHAREDNPELMKARQAGIKIYSFPEYLYEQTKNKIRVVIGGSHGKTTVTSMIMHVLKTSHYNFDYMVGSQVEGFETMVGLSNNSDIAVFEGDEYLSSALDRRPKFHLYKPHIAVITGIAWDHINVFPTFEDYVKQFEIFASCIEEKGTLIYFEPDKLVHNIAQKTPNNITRIPYREHPFSTENNQTYLLNNKLQIPVNLIGKHNMENIEAARNVCNKLNFSDEKFYQAIQTFKGAKKRMDLIKEKNNRRVFFDFAHAPSKLKATVEAVKSQYPSQELVACIELHTFSSLNKSFLPEYKDTMKKADVAIVYFNPETIKHKKLGMIQKSDIQKSFGSGNIKVFDSTEELEKFLLTFKNTDSNFLFMSSGNFNGINIKNLSEKLI